MPGHLPNPWSLLALLVLGLMAASFALTVLACRLEKRPVWPYLPVEEPDPPGPPARGAEPTPSAVGRAADTQDLLTPTDSSARANAAAAASGFQPLGAF